jgi:hypothetical protein
MKAKHYVNITKNIARIGEKGSTQRREDNGCFDNYDKNFSSYEHEVVEADGNPSWYGESDGVKSPKPRVFIRTSTGRRKRLYKKTFKKGVLCDVGNQSS